MLICLGLPTLCIKTASHPAFHLIFHRCGSPSRVPVCDWWRRRLLQPRLRRILQPEDGCVDGAAVVNDDGPQLCRRVCDWQADVTTCPHRARTVPWSTGADVANHAREQPLVQMMIDASIRQRLWVMREDGCTCVLLPQGWVMNDAGCGGLLQENQTKIDFLLKSLSLIEFMSVVRSFWNFAQTTAAMLLWSVQNFKMIRQLRKKV